MVDYPKAMTSLRSSKSQCGLTTIVVNTSQVAKKVQLVTENTEIENLDKQGEAIIVLPPDGKWGWVIVAATFTIHFVNDGLVYTFGLFLNDIAKTLSCSTTKVALANSLLTGILYLSGISLQMTCLSSIIVVSFYFEKWRALAQSIMSCGSSMGVTCFPLIFGILLINQDWRTKFKVMSGCGLLCSLCALSFQLNTFELQNANLGYHLSITRVTTQVSKDTTHHCIWFPKSIARMFDFSMLKSRSFLLISFSGLFTVLGLYTPFMFIVERATTNGISLNVAYHLLTAMGLANTVGRIASGMLLSFYRINILLASYVSLSMTGLILIASSASYNTFFQFLCAILYGISIGLAIVLRPLIIVEMFGLQKLTSCFGMNLVFQGIACLLGIPLSGYLKTLTGSYDPSFYFSGFATILSALLLVPLRSIQNVERRNDCY
ncbi:hypothetical protein RI129_001310 [Pyrocoelia pectoralis]|uniref:Major facilitator superfamily (MFS) profile domain-containing protein n=1 Tax=Pyrocoelia pectoralis TaxID=417401 RepID=A0AAN7VUI2_9COLE